MPGLFNFPGKTNPDLPNPADYIDPFDTGLYIAKDGSDRAAWENLAAVAARASTFLTDRTGRKPYAYPFARNWADTRMDPWEFARTISMHQEYYQDRAIWSAGNGFVHPYNYAYHPAVICHIARWRFELTSVVSINPVSFRVQRNNACFTDFLDNDRISRLGAVNQYFATPSDTHGFGNSSGDYTDNVSADPGTNLGLACRFDNLPTDRGSNIWGTLMNHDGPDNNGRIFYLRAVGPAVVQVFLDAELNRPLSRTSWPTLDANALRADGIPRCYSADIATGQRQPQGQVVHIDVLNAGEKRFLNADGDAVTPYLHRLQSLTGDFDRNLYPERRKYARLVTLKNSSPPGRGTWFRVSDDMHAAAQTYAPAITITTDTDGRITNVDWDREFSGLFADSGAGYSGTNDPQGESAFDAHMMIFSTGVDPADETGIGGAATSTGPEVVQPVPPAQPSDFAIAGVTIGDTANNRETRVAFQEPVTLPADWDLSRPVVISGARATTSGARFFQDYLNGVPHGFELLTPTTGRLYHYDGTTAPGIERTSQSHVLLGGTMTIQRDGFDIPSFGVPAFEPGNESGRQAWPSHVAPSTIQVELLHVTRTAISQNLVKYRASLGARGYKITFNYENRSPAEFQPFDAFIKEMKGQLGQFHLPVRAFGRGAWGNYFHSHPGSVEAWESRSIYPAQPMHLAGDTHLYLTGFEGVPGGSAAPVVHAGDILAVAEPEPLPDNRSRFLTAGEDAHANRYGEAVVKLANPVAREIGNGQHVFLVPELDHVHATLDDNSVTYDIHPAGYYSFSASFHVVA